MRGHVKSLTRRTMVFKGIDEAQIVYRLNLAETRLTINLKMTHFTVDIAKLIVTVRVVGPLAALTVALETVAG